MDKNQILKIVDYFFGISFKISIFLCILHFLGFFSSFDKIYYIALILFIICVIIARIQNNIRRRDD